MEEKLTWFRHGGTLVPVSTEHSKQHLAVLLWHKAIYLLQFAWYICLYIWDLWFQCQSDICLEGHGFKQGTSHKVCIIFLRKFGSRKEKFNIYKLKLDGIDLIHKKTKNLTMIWCFYTTRIVYFSIHWIIFVYKNSFYLNHFPRTMAKYSITFLMTKHYAIETTN